MEMHSRLSPPSSALPLPDERLTGRVFVLKHADMFGVFNERGDILGRVERAGDRGGADGLFQDDTRVLSRLILMLGEHLPERLSAAVAPDNTVLTVDLANPPLTDGNGCRIEAEQLHLRRRCYIWESGLHMAVALRNYAPQACRVPLNLHFGADFIDLFEVRGAKRAERGRTLDVRIGERRVTLSYCGLDRRGRSVTIAFSEDPAWLGEDGAAFWLDLPPHGRRELFVTITAGEEPAQPPDRRSFFRGLRHAKRGMRRCARPLQRIHTSNPQFDEWLQRSVADLALLVTQLDTGPYPYAGIPWFSVPFGRDAIVTALETLWLDPGLARGVLTFLAARQSHQTSAFQDAEPGKIMHETRQGEMANLGEVPFARYFGGVDTTPLFVVLAGHLWRATGDLAFIRRLWPHLRRALAWVDEFGDADGDGFVEYHRAAETGLQNQGWKDSHDSVFHADGRLAEGPIALVEVQGYVCEAKRLAAEMAAALGHDAQAARLHDEAERLFARFNDAFWSEELGTYVLALDGARRPCAVRASNAGHALLCGMAPPARARRVAEALTGPAFFSGWGIRTVAEGEARYNPMAYHNGSIWPHDNALIGAGLARYGFTDLAARVLAALFDAARRFEDHRLPELFCGFRRRSGDFPVAYPEACVPQAWSSGAPFLLLKSCLGLEIDALARAVRVTRPVLPPFLDEVVIEDLAVADARVSLRFGRVDARVETSLLDADGDVSLILRRA